MNLKNNFIFLIMIFTISVARLACAFDMEIKNVSQRKLYLANDNDKPMKERYYLDPGDKISISSEKVIVTMEQPEPVFRMIHEN